VKRDDFILYSKILFDIKIKIVHVYYIDMSVLLENISLVKFIWNYILDQSGVFSISLLVKILMMSFPVLIVCANSQMSI